MVLVIHTFQLFICMLSLKQEYKFCKDKGFSALKGEEEENNRDETQKVKGAVYGIENNTKKSTKFEKNTKVELKYFKTIIMS